MLYFPLTVTELAAAAAAAVVCDVVVVAWRVSTVAGLLLW